MTILTKNSTILSIKSAILTRAGDTNTVTIGDRTYKTVTIGNQIWMAEDLQLDIGNGYIGFYTTSEVNSSIVPIIPDDWRLPYQADITTLSSYIQSDGYSNASQALRSTSDWTQGNGDDIYGFNAKPLGYYNASSHAEVGTAFLIRTTINSGSRIGYAHLWLNSTSTNINWWNGDYNTIYYRMSVRLVKDA